MAEAARATSHPSPYRPGDATEGPCAVTPRQSWLWLPRKPEGTGRQQMRPPASICPPGSTIVRKSITVTHVGRDSPQQQGLEKRTSKALQGSGWCVSIQSLTAPGCDGRQFQPLSFPLPYTVSRALSPRPAEAGGRVSFISAPGLRVGLAQASDANAEDRGTGNPNSAS